MTRIPRLLAVGTLAVAVVAVSGAARADEVAAAGAVLNTTFVGTAVNWSDIGPRGMTTTFRVHIDQLTPDSEADRFASILRLRGEKTLQNELASRNVGYLQLDSRFPEPLAAAFLTEIDGHRHLLLLTERPVSFREIWSNARSADYGFRVIELDLDAKGSGDGSMFVAARFKVEKDGSLGARNFGFLPWRILNLRAFAS